MSKRKISVHDTRDSDIRKLWEARPNDKRTGNDVLAFYGELATDHSFLVPSQFVGRKDMGDPYQQLKTILRGRVRDPQ